jgi:hypothetical protein
MPRLIQEVLKPLIEYKKWRGIDNLATDNLRVPPGFVRSANNVDIDSEDMMHMRQGVLQSLLSGDSHSLWSDEGDLCFLVKDNDLLQITSVYKSGAVWMASYSILLVGVGHTKMNFVPVGHKTFFSNLVKNGYIEDGVAYGFPEVDKSILKNSFKTRMPGGNLMEYFNGRIYVAQDEGMYFSDAYNPGVMDERKSFYTLGGGATMMLAVKDGLYISAGSKVFFALYKGEVNFPIEGGNLKIPDFDYKLLLDVPAIKGSAVAIERMDLGKGLQTHQGVLGRVVIFSTGIGIFMGLPGGYLKDCTSDFYAVYDIEEGAAMIKWHNGYRQYVFLGQMSAGVGGAGVEIVDPNSTIQIYG